MESKENVKDVLAHIDITNADEVLNMNLLQNLIEGKGASPNLSQYCDKLGALYQDYLDGALNESLEKRFADVDNLVD
mgnify:CR=1 FL=1